MSYMSLSVIMIDWGNLRDEICFGFTPSARGAAQNLTLCPFVLCQRYIECRVVDGGKRPSGKETVARLGMNGVITSRELSLLTRLNLCTNSPKSDFKGLPFYYIKQGELLRLREP